MKHQMITISASLLMLLFLAYQSLAEDVPYLSEITKEKIHESLDPSSDPPAQLRSRGLEKVQASCNFNEQERGRGLEKVGKAEDVKSVAFPILFDPGKAT